MSKIRIWFLVSIAILATSTMLLISSSSLLTLPILKEHYIPLGTPITWLGIISLPSSIYFGKDKLRNPTKPFSIYLSKILKTFLFIAILWAPVCYVLSGNFSFSFTEKTTFQGGQLAMIIFWRFTYITVAAPIIIIVIHWFSLLFTKSNQK